MYENEVVDLMDPLFFFFFFYYTVEMVRLLNNNTDEQLPTGLACQCKTIEVVIVSISAGIMYTMHYDMGGHGQAHFAGILMI